MGSDISKLIQCDCCPKLTVLHSSDSRKIKLNQNGSVSSIPTQTKYAKKVRLVVSEAQLQGFRCAEVHWQRGLWESVHCAEDRHTGVVRDESHPEEPAEKSIFAGLDIN